MEPEPCDSESDKTDVMYSFNQSQLSRIYKVTSKLRWTYLIRLFHTCGTSRTQFNEFNESLCGGVHLQQNSAKLVTRHFQTNVHRQIVVLTSDLDGVFDLGGLVSGHLADVVTGVVLVGQRDDQSVAVGFLGQLKIKSCHFYKTFLEEIQISPKFRNPDIVCSDA